MLIEMQNPVMLARAVEIISEIVNEVRIKVGEAGLSITAMDPANVSMVGFRLPKSSFSRFEAGTETLGVNLDNLKQVLKRCGSGSLLIMEKKDNFLEMQIRDRIKRNFALSLIDIESNDIDFNSKTERMEFSSSVELNSIDLVDSIEDCSVVSDSCSFIIDNERFIIEAKGLNSARAEFSGDEARIKAENCKARYSLEYLQKFIKGARLAEKAVLEFANDHPLKMEFRNELMELKFVLAPRVENED
jgi:proliferating cell nuclear antigen